MSKRGAKTINHGGQVLTVKEKLFVEEYLVDLNATQAYYRAGYVAKTRNAAGTNSDALLNKPHIQAAVQFAVDKRAERTQLFQDQVIEELKRIAFSNMTDFATWDTNKVSFKTSDELKGQHSAVISEISQTETLRGSQIKLKLHDKIKALEGLAKHLGLFNTKVEIEEDGKAVKSITINL